MNYNRQDIEEQLLLQYLQGQADDVLVERIHAWLEADSGNRAHLDRLESLWLETGKLDPAPVAVDIDQAWQRMTARMDAAENTGTRVRRLFPPKVYWGVAASVLLLAGLFIVFRLIRPEPMREMMAVQEVLSDTLPDGSSVMLNKHARLTFPAQFDQDRREVKLEGEAFFKVQHDAHQPFIVDAGSAFVRVLGTSFRVNAGPERNGVVEVEVAEGKVMFFSVNRQSNDTLSLILTAGESGIFENGQFRLIMDEESDPDALYWATGGFNFRRTPLSVVFAVLEQHFPIRITAENQDILQCRLTATFPEDSPANILTVIAESFGLTLETNANQFILSGRGCSDEDN
jgi:ferric-dicitrate binding protein FerR (iron transport regulator)